MEVTNCNLVLYYFSLLAVDHPGRAAKNGHWAHSDGRASQANDRTSQNAEEIESAAQPRRADERLMSGKYVKTPETTSTSNRKK